MYFVFSAAVKMLRALVLSLCVASALSASAKWRPSIDASNRFMVKGGSKLVGGQPAEPNQFPWQESVQLAALTFA